MIKESIENYLKAAQKLTEEAGILTDISDLLCSFDGFKKLIEVNNLKPTVMDRDDEYFCYRAFVEIDGYKFTTLLTKHEYETYMKERIA